MGIMNTVMRKQAIGCMVMVSGKVRGQRAKAQKYVSGYLISTGQPKREFLDTAIRHVLMRQGVLGLKVQIMADVKKVMPNDTSSSCQIISKSTSQRMTAETQLAHTLSKPVDKEDKCDSKSPIIVIFEVIKDLSK